MCISRADKVENYIIRTGYTIAQLLSILDSLAFPFLTFYLILFVVGNLSFENVLSMQSKLERSKYFNYLKFLIRFASIRRLFQRVSSPPMQKFILYFLIITD